ncbi:MAG: archaeosortase/exosortase family protein [Hyphomicrobium sp.]|nr:archaeosortase/exosortase family protein [Hyphomicrobium sp.]
MARRLSRREVFFWAFTSLAAQSLLLTAFASSFLGVTDAAEVASTAPAAQSAFQVLAWYAIFQLVFESRSQPRAWVSDYAVALLACCAVLVSSNALVSGAALMLVGLYLWKAADGDEKLKSAAVVALALAANMYWAPKIFEFVSLPLLRVDAALVGALLSLFVPGVTWSDTIITSSNHSIGIYGACSSFHNISLAILCWITITKLIRSKWMASDRICALAVIAAVVIFNTARLALMARGPVEFAFWHNGSGADIVVWMTTLTVVALSLWGATRKGAAS